MLMLQMCVTDTVYVHVCIADFTTCSRVCVLLQQELFVDTTHYPVITVMAG